MKRECSLKRDLVIEGCGLECWDALKGYHYRLGEPGFVDKVFAIYSNRAMLGIKVAGVDRPIVGVIVYSMPAINSKLRNMATGGRYLGLGRSGGLRLLNKEMRCISRVVILPQFRGMSLGSWLVKETMDLAGTKFVESLAVMGRVNPFFEKAGMIRFDGQLAAGNEKLLAAFDAMGISDEDLLDVGSLIIAIDKLESAKRNFVEKQMFMFASKYVNGKKLSMEKVLELVVDRVWSWPAYFIWSEEGMRKKV